MAAQDPPGTGPARGAVQGGGPARGSAGERGAPRVPGRQPAARRTAKEVTYPDTRTRVEQRANHAPNPLRLGSPATCAGELGGAGAVEVPVPTSCAAHVAASAQERGSPETRLLLPSVSGETESARRGGADINPSAAAPAHAPRPTRLDRRFPARLPGHLSRGPGIPNPPPRPGPGGAEPGSAWPSIAPPEAALRWLHRIQLAGWGVGVGPLRPRTAPRTLEV